MYSIIRSLTSALAALHIVSSMDDSDAHPSYIRNRGQALWITVAGNVAVCLDPAAGQ